MDEVFSRQTRRFSAAILTYGKGNRRSMAGNRPARRCAAVVNSGSKGTNKVSILTFLKRFIRSCKLFL